MCVDLELGEVTSRFERLGTVFDVVEEALDLGGDLGDFEVEREERGPELDAALERLSAALTRADAQGELAPWTGLVWRHAIAHYPGRFVPAYGRPCVAVGRQGSWLVNTDGERTELAHLPYLRQLLCAFVELHARCDAGALDTHEVFERGWPGEQVTLEAMKSRVYVGISKLRGFGLEH